MIFGGLGVCHSLFVGIRVVVSQSVVDSILNEIEPISDNFERVVESVLSSVSDSLPGGNPSIIYGLTSNLYALYCFLVAVLCVLHDSFTKIAEGLSDGELHSVTEHILINKFSLRHCCIHFIIWVINLYLL